MCMCIDFCTLNANTHVDWYPIPCIDDLLNWLHGAHMCSQKLIYMQVIIRSESEKVTSTILHFRVIGDCMNIQ